MWRYANFWSDGQNCRITKKWTLVWLWKIVELQVTFIIFLPLKKYTKSDMEKSAHNSKLTVCKNSTIYALSSWHLVKMITSWDHYFHQVSWGYGKNCGIFTNGQLCDVCTFFLNRLYLEGELDAKPLKIRHVQFSGWISMSKSYWTQWFKMENFQQ